MTSAAPAILAEGLGHAYGPRWRRRSGGAAPAPAGAVLDGVDLHVEPGGLVGVLGPNGAGKSTLLRILATLEPPAAGTVRLLERHAYPPDAALRRRIGYAGETATHLDALTGRENAIFFARAAGLDRPAAARAVDVLLERLRLAADAHRPVGHYSFGMRRKLLLIEALAHSPDLLLLDEPTIGLDPVALAAAAGLLRERAAAGAAVLIATHDTTAARRLCDRVLFLHAGRIVLGGAPDALIARHGGPHRIDVELDDAGEAGPERLPALEGVAAAVRNGTGWTVQAPGGAAVLPALCQTLIAAGAGIRSIRVREPGLGDVFRAVTGAELLEAGADASAAADGAFSGPVGAAGDTLDSSAAPVAGTREAP